MTVAGVEISKGTNLKLQYSHAIFVGRSSFKDKDELLKMINELRHPLLSVLSLCGASPTE